jgi:hypothetical protein
VNQYVQDSALFNPGHRPKLMSLVEKYGYDDIASASRERGGLPGNRPFLTDGVEDIDGFSACNIARKEDWVDLYAARRMTG